MSEWLKLRFPLTKRDVLYFFCGNRIWKAIIPRTRWLFLSKGFVFQFRVDLWERSVRTMKGCLSQKRKGKYCSLLAWLRSLWSDRPNCSTQYPFWFRREASATPATRYPPRSRRWNGEAVLEIVYWLGSRTFSCTVALNRAESRETAQHQ